MFAVPSQDELVGRESEVARLNGVVAALRSGQGAVLEIAGDPGIGKTGLLSTLAAMAANSGIRVLRAHAVRGTDVPYQVFRDAWGDQLGFETAVEGPAADPGQHWIPGLTSTLTRFRMGLRIRLLLTEWAAGGGGVLILDDLHLCDKDSAEVVTQLIRSPVSGPFLLAVAHRPRQTRSMLLETLNQGAYAGTVIRLEPGPLNGDEAALLLHRWWSCREGNADGHDLLAVNCSEAAFADDADPEAAWSVDQWVLDADWSRRENTRPHLFMEQLWAAAGGNPRNMRILAAAQWHPDIWPDQPGTNRDGLLREAVTLVAELDALTSEDLNTAYAAAVLGDPFRAEDVATVSGLGLGRTLAAFAELARRDLLRPLASGGRFVFRHRVLCHVTHERAGPSFRLPAHRRALELLTVRGASAAARARHAEHLLGGDDPLPRQVLVDGAAEVVGEAPATAARWLCLALASWPDGDRTCQDRATLTLAACRALIATGRLEDARTLAHEVLNDGVGLPEGLRLRAYAACVDAERLLGRYQEAEALAHTALEALPRPLPVPLPGGVAEMAFQYGLVHALRGTYGGAQQLIREVADAVDGAGDATELTVQILSAFGDAHTGNICAAAPEVTRYARSVDALPDAAVARVPEALAMLGCSEIYLQRFADASRHLRRGLKVSSGGAQRHMVTHYLIGLSMLEAWAGRLDQARHYALEAERAARAIGADDAVGLAMTTRAAALIWAYGRRDACEILGIAEAGARTTVGGKGWWACTAFGQLAEVRLMSGDASGCMRILLEEGGGHSLSLLPPPRRPEALSLLASAALRCGERDTAHRSLENAEEVAERLGLSAPWAFVKRARAELLEAEGEHHAAVKLAEESAEAFRRAGMPVHHAWTLVTAVHAVEATEGHAVALAWLDEAVTVSRTCGAVRVREEAVRLRGELTTRETTAAPADGPWNGQLSVLTGREREIARLAAEGKRSKEIAERLLVSPRTVEAHLGRIYRKLDVSSRAALVGVVLQFADSGDAADITGVKTEAVDAT